MDPCLLIESAIKLLKPGGQLVISTPNSQMCWRPPLDFPPHHLSRFTPQALRALLTNAGLRIVDHIEQMSCLDLTRHFVGNLLRSKKRPTLRGGEFRLRRVSHYARRVLNISRPILMEATRPVDRLLHKAGIRYIGQLVISTKQDENA
jgi:hypothetical protein